MKKTLLAVAIPAAIFANSVAAVQVYDDGKTTFAIGGHMSAQLAHEQNKGFEAQEDGSFGYTKDTTRVEDNSARINFVAKTDLGNGVTAEAKAEWGISAFTDTGEVFFNRVGQISLDSDFGKVTVGRQWSVFYDAINASDAPIVFGNDFLYDNNSGSGRVSRSIAYRNGFDFGTAGALDFGVLWAGGEGQDSDDLGQFSASYSVMGAKLGYSFSEQGDAQLQAVSASYGSFGKGLFLATTYAMGDDTFSAFPTNSESKVVLDEGTAYDAIVSYGFKNGLTLSANYELVEHDNSDFVVREESAVIAQQALTKNFTVYGGHQFDLRDDEQHQNVGDKTIVGMRVYF